MADIKFVVSVDTASGKAAIKQLDGEVQGLTKTTEKSGGIFKQAWAQIAGGMAVYDGLKKAGRAFVDFIGDSVAAAAEAEAADKALAAALELTGRSVDANLSHFTEYAGQLQSVTVYEDDAVKQAQTLLVQLTKLDRQGIDAATRGAIGLASVLKVDLQSAAQMVAKAMEGNYTALGRYGIKVRETGTEEEKRADLLSKLEVFYKRAEAETNTYEGALKQLQNSMGELKETVGGAILGSDAFKEGIKKAKEAVDKLAQSNDFKLWLDTVIKGIEEAVKLAGSLVKGIKDISESLAGTKKANKEFEESQVRLAAAIARMRASGADVHREFKAVEKAVKDTGAPVKQAAVAIEHYKTSWEKLSPAIKAVVNGHVEIKKTSSGAQAGLEDLKKCEEESQREHGKYAREVISAERQIAEAWEAAYENSVRPTYEDWGKLLTEHYGYILDYCAGMDSAFTDMKTNLGDTFVEIGLGHKGLLEGMGDVMESFANDAGAVMRKFLADLVTETMRTWVLKQTQALASVVASVMKGVPFPLNLALVGGAIATVTALFSRVRAFEEGGIVTRPTMGLVGEAGPEAIIPLSKTTVNNYLGQGDARRPAQPIHIHVSVGSERLADAVVRINDEQSALGRMKIHARAIVP